ncbi:MAG: ankyrin repeat domain-containing protein [Wolbachia endosymbiont of Fragariocoptes setiger]|nr:ankyrin repeat domain-containing protein [Wolbachia endosymbiont of Fragariocoptes setiger]
MKKTLYLTLMITASHFLVAQPLTDEYGVNIPELEGTSSQKLEVENDKELKIDNEENQISQDQDVVMKNTQISKNDTSKVEELLKPDNNDFISKNIEKSEKNISSKQIESLNEESDKLQNKESLTVPELKEIPNVEQLNTNSQLEKKVDKDTFDKRALTKDIKMSEKNTDSSDLKEKERDSMTMLRKNLPQSEKLIDQSQVETTQTNENKIVEKDITVETTKKKEELQSLTKEKVSNEWQYRSERNTLNLHDSELLNIRDYSEQFFYCINKNNVSCLRAIMYAIEKIGLNIEEVLKLKNKLGDTPLIYAVKYSDIDTVRFLLLQYTTINYNLQPILDIAIERKQYDIINAVAEMNSLLIEYKNIDNAKNSAMYGWAMNRKESNVSKFH